MPRDPNQLSATEIVQIEAGTNHPLNHGCNVQIHDGVTPAGFRGGDELKARKTLEAIEAFLATSEPSLLQAAEDAQSVEWARIGVPVGLAMMVIYFLLLRFAV